MPGGWLAPKGDVEAAKLLMAGKAYVEALFHCQQAAEKALKAFLTFHQRPFRKTHDLSELTPECVLIENSLPSILEPAKVPMKYAWQFCYPGAPYEPDALAAADALRRAEAVVREVDNDSRGPVSGRFLVRRILPRIIIEHG